MSVGDRPDAASMVLLTGFYLDPSAERQRELVECLRRNVDNAGITEMNVFVEYAANLGPLISTYPPLASPKVRLVVAGRRVTFRDLFDHANRELAGRRVIIANADIFFDHTLSRLSGYDLSGRLLCLSRWDVGRDGAARLFDSPVSQDAWIFQAPIRAFPCAFHLGVPGCDNRLACEASDAGLEVSNPSRSVRAHHLHLSGVRRYTPGHGLPGPTRAVAPSYLAAPWLWFVVPCRGRLDDVQRTIGSVLAQPLSTYTLVDYSCPQGAGEWVRKRDPTARVVTVPGQTRFHGAHARNQGAAAADEDAILCFLDADVEVAPDFSRHVLSCFQEGAFLVPDRGGPGLDTALVCSRAAFARAGGYDEALLYWGDEVRDFRGALRRVGLAEQRFPAGLLSHGGRRDAPRSVAASFPERKTTRAIHAAYRRTKAAMYRETRGQDVSRTALREIFEAIARAHRAEASRTLPCASVAFRETMGYTLERLESGASSHNNDPRPLADVPSQLAGRRFTQVVSGRAAPVEVEFLSAGKLYVLVGTDWEGHAPASAWLREAGQREPVPPVETLRGTAFEVWSLLGETGDRFVIPTQVMLVSDHLERRA